MLQKGETYSFGQSLPPLLHSASTHFLLLLCIHTMADAGPKGPREMGHPRNLKKNNHYISYVYACVCFYDKWIYPLDMFISTGSPMGCWAPDQP